MTWSEGSAEGTAARDPSPAAGTAPPPWHALSTGRAFELLASDIAGLSAAEAAARLARHGPNALVLARPTPWWRILATQFRGVVMALLGAVMVVALLLGDLVEAVAVLAVLLINGLLGFWMEWRARQAMEGLRRLQVQAAVVRRDGRPRSIDARDLVPGDVIELEAGSAVPADARLVECTDLTAVEAPLTGESVPVRKTAAPVDADAALADRASMLYKGTLVAVGGGTAVVVATGPSTEVGRVTELVAETETEETPLERRLDHLGRRLVGLTLAVAGIVTALGLARGEELWRMVETGLALAVAAVPEGLPVVATLALAVGMRRMARRNALVRRLPAVEALGSATVICTDKTGTLTAGEMTVTRLVLATGGDGGGSDGAGLDLEVTGTGYAPRGELRRGGRAVATAEVPGLGEALAAAVLPNRATLAPADGGGDGEGGAAPGGSDVAWTITGDPTEAALLVAALKAGVEGDRLLAERPRVGEVPFTSERMWMASFHRRNDGATVAYVKGAPGKILELCTRRLDAAAEAPGDGEPPTVPLDASGREALLGRNRALAGQGLRVLALARRVLPAGAEPGEAAVADLTFLGFAGISDPPAPGAATAVARFQAAGVRTVMITGDQAVTARAVAGELGLLRPGDEIVEGRDLETLDDAELESRVEHAAVFCRTSPAQKLRIVDALQRRGEIVAMLGDGVNDAPALKSADIGVAMGGRGTDVAKETAAVVLQDDRFESVAAAVEEGRVIFDNVRKFILFLFSCNLAEVLVLFLAGVFAWPIPLTPLQILWLNLLTDVFPALALAVEPAEPDVMERPPRDPASGLLSRGFLALVVGYGAVITAATLAAFLWGLGGAGGDGGGEGDVPRAMTLAFVTLALAQLFHVVNARSPRPLLFTRRLFANRWMVAAVVLTVGLQLLAVYLPGLSSILDTVPLAPRDWAVVLPLSLLPMILGQMGKALRRQPIDAALSTD